MSKELIVSVGRHETRVAVLEDDQLVEIYHEREKEYSLAGSIHKGRVTRVLPGMQSAFVDIGLERDAFLYVSDFFEDGEEYDAVVSVAEDKVLGLDAPEGGAEAPAVASEPRAERPERQDRPDRGDRGGRDRRRGRDRGRDRDRDRNRDRERPPQVVAAVVEPAAEPSEPVAAEVAEAVAAPLPETAPREQRENRGDRGDRGDRNNRGRRGRRRGGRGGFPDSKYSSPRQMEPRPEPRGEEPAEELEDLPPIILPGESLAKYSGVEVRTIDELLAPEPEPELKLEISREEADEAVAELHEEIQEAIQIQEQAAAPEPEPTPEPAPVPEPEIVTASAPEPEPEREPEPEPVVEHVSVTDPEDAAIDAAELASDEMAEDALQATAEEGPEPARIPTSLTAQLREQGHRYPHRVSRRMRRKMRQGEPGSEPRPALAEVPEDGLPVAVEGEDPAAEAIVLEGEVKQVQPREEHRRDRGDRGRRDRGDRGERGDRGDRGDRSERPERSERPDRTDRPPLPSIADLLKQGQEIIVQIAKEPIGQKGARITSHIALPGRFVVYMPTVEHVGVSRKIPSDDERQRLKKVLATHRQGIPGGFICRTAADGKTEDELRADMHFLYNLWLDLRQKAEKRPAPMLLHHDLDLVQRILRDQVTSSFKAIWVDNEEMYENVVSFMHRHQPALVGRVKMYTRPAPIFDEFGITAELEKALRPKVWMKSGGYIVINQTEALVAIDINTGKYVGKSNRLEDTIVKVNTDAVKEIVRQIRLRDLGGIIVVDFIDMEERKNRAKVMQALEEAMRSDRAPNKILQFNDFGLVAITRKRVKQSLERTLCSPCPYCEGAGHVKAVHTVVGEILSEAQRMKKALEDGQNNVVLRVNPEVAKVLKSNKNTYLQEIEEMIGKSVIVRGDPLLHQAKFDLA